MKGNKIEADKDISDVKFVVVLTGIEIDTILEAVGIATTEMRRRSGSIPDGFDFGALSSGCYRLFKPIEVDYKNRCVGK